MFDLTRHVHTGKDARQPISGHGGKVWLPAESVQFAAITQNPEDSATLQRIAASYSRKISMVDTSDAAIGLLKNQPTPLVICDRDLWGETWRSGADRHTTEVLQKPTD